MKLLDVLITGGEPEIDEEMNQIDYLRSQGIDPADIEKRLSQAFGNKQKRQNQLVSRLKRRRSYKNPVKGGTGKQNRTRRKKFAKHAKHDQSTHGNWSRKAPASQRERFAVSEDKWKTIAGVSPFEDEVPPAIRAWVGLGTYEGGDVTPFMGYRLPEPTVVYRGERAVHPGGKPRDLPKHKIGDTVSFDKPTSASLSPAVAVDFAFGGGKVGNLYEVSLPRGAKVLGVTPQSKMNSENDTLSEVIVAPSEYTVIEVRQEVVHIHPKLPSQEATVYTLLSNEFVQKHAVHDQKTHGNRNGSMSPTDVANEAVKRGADKFFHGRIRDMANFASTVSGSFYGDRKTLGFTKMSVAKNWPLRGSIMLTREDDAKFRLFNTKKEFKVKRVDKGKVQKHAVHDQKTHGPKKAPGRSKSDAESGPWSDHLNDHAGTRIVEFYNGHEVWVRYEDDDKPVLSETHKKLLDSVPQELWDNAENPIIIFTNGTYMTTQYASGIHEVHGDGLYTGIDKVWQTTDGVQHAVWINDTIDDVTQMQHNLMHELGHAAWFRSPDVGWQTKKYQEVSSIFEKVIDDSEQYADTPLDPWAYSRSLSQFQQGPETAADMLSYMMVPQMRNNIEALTVDYTALDWWDGQFGGRVPEVEYEMFGSNKIHKAYNTTGFKCGVPDSYLGQEPVTKHLPGQHDQSTHGNRASSYKRKPHPTAKGVEVFTITEGGEERMTASVRETPTSLEIDWIGAMGADNTRKGYGMATLDALAEEYDKPFILGSPNPAAIALYKKWRKARDRPYDYLQQEGLTDEGEVGNLVEFNKHLPGQHDQMTHGNRKGKRGDWGKDSSERREGNRRSTSSESIYPGKCYELSARSTVDTEGSTLVHGIIQHETGDVAHGWVRYPDGYILEPSSDRVYHPEDFESIYEPITIEEYSVGEVREKFVGTGNFGPWDSLSGLWYQHYYGGVPDLTGLTLMDHATASKEATEQVLKLQKMLEES